MSSRLLLKPLFLLLAALMLLSSCKGCKWLKVNGCDTCGRVNASKPK